MNRSLALAALMALGFQDQTPKNPEYTWWAPHKAGSWVRSRTETVESGLKVVIEITRTLAEITPGKAVIEQKIKITIGSKARPEETAKEEILRDKEETPLKIEKEGDEEITVAGKKIKCHWIQGIEEEKVKVKYWISKDIPGGVARAENSGPDITGVMKTVALAWEKK